MTRAPGQSRRAARPPCDRHPFRTVRFVNKTGFTLEPGPIAIFGRGTFVGDTLLARLDVDETAWIPYASRRPWHAPPTSRAHRPMSRRGCAA